MLTSIRSSLVLVLFLLASGLSANSLQNASQLTEDRVTYTDLTVTPVSSTMAHMDWEGSSPSYTVTIRNLNTGQVEQTFQTSNTSMNVGNLKQGSAYSFEVRDNGYIIIDTMEMN